MCQDGLTVAGQFLDLVAFFIIASEWYHQLRRDHERRLRELQKAHDQQAAESLGETYVDPDNDRDNWRMYQPLFLSEWRWRRRMFIIGAVCFTVGTALQVLGSWPGLIAKCS